MMLHEYLEEVIGSKVKVKILRVMFKFPTKIFTGRELAKQIEDVSHMAVSNSLKSLISMNIIKQEAHGNSQLLSLNKESYLFGILGDLFYHENNTLNNLIKKLRDLLKNYKKEATIVLFGSVVKKTESFNSDIDLLVITKHKKDIESKINGLQSVISKEFGNALSPYFMGLKEFKNKKNSRFINEIKKNHIIILGDKLK